MPTGGNHYREGGGLPTGPALRSIYCQFADRFRSAALRVSDEGGAALCVQIGHEHEPDGEGFDISETPSESLLGLGWMRERAHLVEGSMTVESSLRRGTTIFISVPLPGPKLVPS
jgi:hypothetical protein